MPIELISKIKPKNGGLFPIVEDVDVEGGFQVRADTTDRDSIPTANRKIGMLVFVQSNSTYYTLNGGITNSNWIAAALGSSIVAETIAVTANGQTSFTLSQPPAQPTAVSMFVNGLRQTYTTDFTVSSNIVTYISTVHLITTDKVDFLYTGGGGFAGTLGLDVKQNSTTIDPNANHMNFTGNVTVTNGLSGSVNVAINTPPDSKIRVFTSSNLAGAAVSVAKVTVWNSISSLIAQQNASIISGNTQITTTQTGRFDISGQLSIQPTAGSIDGVVIEVVRNGSVIQSMSDFGAVWAIGVTRSIGFHFPLEMSASDVVQVQWTHSGSMGSTTQLMGGDAFSWLAFDKLNSVTADTGSAQDFIVTPIKTSLYSPNTNELVQCDATGGAFTINLPTASGRANKHIVIKNVSNSTNAITIAATGIETIDGQFTQTINVAYQAFHLVSNGVNWIII